MGGLSNDGIANRRLLLLVNHDAVTGEKKHPPPARNFPPLLTLLHGGTLYYVHNSSHRIPNQGIKMQMVKGLLSSSSLPCFFFFALRYITP